MGYTEAGTDDVGDGVVLRADCDELATGSTPVCDSAEASAGADLGSEDVQASARCGAVSGLGLPCPFDVGAGLELGTRAGDAGVFARAEPVSATVCAETPATNLTCLP